MSMPTFTVVVEMTIAAPTPAKAGEYARQILGSNKARIDEHTRPTDDMIWVDWATRLATSQEAS